MKDNWDIGSPRSDLFLRHLIPAIALSLHVRTSSDRNTYEETDDQKLSMVKK